MTPEERLAERLRDMSCSREDLGRAASTILALIEEKRRLEALLYKPSDADVERVALALFRECYGDQECIPWPTYGDKESFRTDARISIAALAEPVKNEEAAKE